MISPQKMQSTPDLSLKPKAMKEKETVKLIETPEGWESMESALSEIQKWFHAEDTGYNRTVINWSFLISRNKKIYDLAKWAIDNKLIGMHETGKKGEIQISRTPLFNFLLKKK